MKKQFDTALQDLEADHQILNGIFAAVRAAEFPCAPSKPCRFGDCKEGVHCAQQMREHFHRSMFAVVGHFGREDKLIRELLPNDSFLRHTEQHADLSGLLQQAIIEFSKIQDVKAAKASLCAIAIQLDTHHRTQDSEYSRLYSKSKPDATPIELSTGFISRNSLTALPLTGHAQIDEEHAQLHDIMHRTLGLCHVSYPDCNQCHENTQQHCAEAAIDLVTDALKFMVEHFRHEEALLKQQPQVSGAQAHIDNHAELSRRMSRLIGDYEDNNTALCLFRLVGTLHIWLYQHVLEHDLPFISQLADLTNKKKSGVPLALTA
jgi:hemerythrin